MAKTPSPRSNFIKSGRRQQPPRLWGKDTLLIERMSQEGRGVARRAGKIVFVSAALQGEQVRVQCTAVKRDYDEADMIELAAASTAAPTRVQPECPVYHDCGGCSLQHWSLQGQQRHKQDRLLTMMRAISPALELEPAIDSEPSGFRHRLRLLVTRAANRTYSFGLRRRHSHNAVSLAHCLVANASVNDLLDTLPKRLSTLPELQGLRELEIDSDSDNKLGLCFYFAAHPGEQVLSELAMSILADPVVAIRVRLGNRKKSGKDESCGESEQEDLNRWQELYTAGELCLRLALPHSAADPAAEALRLGYLPGDFTQTHWGVNAALVARALDWLQPGTEDHALDLFAGIGNFSLPLAQRVKTVHALEGDSAMSRRVSANAAHNDIHNIRAKTVNLMAESITLPRANIAIIDPPRAGASSVCAALARSRLERLVYVSCHPATLLRDAKILQSAGFSLSKAAAVDMFPHTGHSEAIALFQRKS